MSDMLAGQRRDEVFRHLRQETIAMINEYADPKKTAAMMIKGLLVSAMYGFADEREKEAHVAMLEACAVVLGQSNVTCKGGDF